MRKTVAAAAVFLLFLTAASAAASEKGAVVDAGGKAELKLPGGGWQPARPGAEIPAGTVIATGFNSWVLIRVANAEVRIEPLSRLTLAEAVRRQDGVKAGVKTDLRLRVGKIRVDIRPEPDLTVNFSVRSPASTAAVRGTSFTYDGVNVQVLDGAVSLSDGFGRSRRYTAGQRGRTARSGPPQAAGAAAEASWRPRPFLRTGEPLPGVRENAVPVDVVAARGTLVISW
jgi:hypothetical protein